MKAFSLGIVAALFILLPTQAPAQSGKPIVAIYQMEDLTGSGQAQTFSTMIETAISSTSKFRVIERSRISTLVGEQGRARSGLVTSGTPGRVGGFEGADFLVYGTITSFSTAVRADIGSTFVAGLFASPNTTGPTCTNTVATLGIDIKITDARTGEVRYVSHLDEVQKSAASCDGATQVDAASLMRAAADKVAAKLVMAIYPIQIAAVQGDGSVVLNYGEGSIQVGAVMVVYSKGDVIRDPATGEVLSNDEVKLGFIRVTEVNGRVSKAAPISAFASPPAIGAIVRPASAEDIQAINKASRRRG